jgi:hypothetical protein
MRLFRLYLPPETQSPESTDSANRFLKRLGLVSRNAPDALRGDGL